MLKEAGMCWHKCYRILAGPAKVLQGGLSCPVLDRVGGHKLKLQQGIEIEGKKVLSEGRLT